MRKWYSYGLAGVSIAVLAACSSPDDARDELRPDDPVDIALDQLPLVKIEGTGDQVIPLLLGEAEGVEYVTDQETGDLLIQVELPALVQVIDLNLLSLLSGITGSLTLPMYISPLELPPGLVGLVDDIELADVSLGLNLTLNRPATGVDLENMVICLESDPTICTEPARGADGSTLISADAGVPVYVEAAGGDLLREGMAAFTSPEGVRLRVQSGAPITDRNLQLALQNNLCLPACTLDLSIDGSIPLPLKAKVVSEGLALDTPPIFAQLKDLQYHGVPLLPFGEGGVEDLQEATRGATLHLEIINGLPFEIYSTTLWAGELETDANRIPTELPRFDHPNPGDFLYAVKDATIAPAEVDENGYALAPVTTELDVKLTGPEAAEFLGLLAQDPERIFVSLRLALTGPESSGRVFAVQSDDILYINAGISMDLQIGGEDE